MGDITTPGVLMAGKNRGPKSFRNDDTRESLRGTLRSGREKVDSRTAASSQGVPRMRARWKVLAGTKIRPLQKMAELRQLKAHLAPREPRRTRKEKENTGINPDYRRAPVENKGLTILTWVD